MSGVRPSPSNPVELFPLSQAPDSAARRGDLRKAAQQFEGMMLGLLMKSMRATVEPSGLLGDSGQARSTYEYLYDQGIADRAMAAGRGWGLAQRLVEQWERQNLISEKKRSGNSPPVLKNPSMQPI